DHPQQEFLARLPAGKWDDRLGVESQPTLVDCVSDPSHPGKRVELAADTLVLCLLVAGVAEDDDHAVGLPAVEQRRGRVGDRADRSVLARERLVAPPGWLAQLADP